MATTTNFGWPTPDDTDLVKNGAAAMRSLGSGIDTSLVKLKGGTTGQILSKASNTDLDYVWIANDQGDITAVTAGTGITGGGTSGAVTITNEMATTIDAKGDLIAGTADNAFARLAVGSNGQTLVADSSQTTGLGWANNFAAGKNKLINPDFYINQRNFSSTTTSNTYGHDRWTWSYSGGTCTYSNQTFTPGTAPVAGYEGKNFLRLATSGQSAAGDLNLFYQNIEDVRTLAGQAVTYSFWAKAASGTPKIAIETEQYFGTGGSPSATIDTYQGQITLTGGTSWTRYSISFTMPSVSGKTIGTTTPGAVAILTWTSAGSNWNARTGTLGIQNNTIDIWGVQLEAGSVATAFQTATGTIQGELAACQRYYNVIGGNVVHPIGTGYASATSQSLRWPISFPVQMRIAPSITKNGTWAVSNAGQPSATFISSSGFAFEITSTAAGIIYAYPDSTDDTLTISAEL